MKEINANKETLKRNLLDLIELQHILQGTQIFFSEVYIYALLWCVCPAYNMLYVLYRLSLI